jgi:hypothetical protein
VVAAVALVHGDAALGQIGACCLGNATCVTTDAGGCSILSGQFLGAGTSCASVVCAGACCLADKQCQETSSNQCATLTGSFQGAETTCDLNCPSTLGTSFTYQGQLKQNGLPVNGSVDLEFSLWTTPQGGDQVRPTVPVDNIQVVNGLFTAELDFGAIALSGNARWLEVAVRSPHDPTDTGPFTMLTPRQPVTGTPYAVQTRGIFVDDGSNVGIGTLTPSEKLQVVGIVHSAAGGFKFPDATVQTTAVTGSGGGVPVGTVLDWWRPNSSFPIPEGYQICEGSVVSDPQSPLNGFTLPDLRNRFVRGAATLDVVGLTGGAETHDHSVSTPAHVHSIDHTHTVSGNTQVLGMTTAGPSGSLVGAGSASPGAASPAHTHTLAPHSHSVAITTGSPSSGSSGPGGETVVASATAEHLPPYVGLLKIMRIR